MGSEIPLTNFRGIELRDLPAESARLALIIAEFQCDVLYPYHKNYLKSNTYKCSGGGAWPAASLTNAQNKYTLKYMCFRCY